MLLGFLRRCLIPVTFHALLRLSTHFLEIVSAFHYICRLFHNYWKINGYFFRESARSQFPGVLPQQHPPDVIALRIVWFNHFVFRFFLQRLFLLECRSYCIFGSAWYLMSILLFGLSFPACVLLERQMVNSRYLKVVFLIDLLLCFFCGGFKKYAFLFTCCYFVRHSLFLLGVKVC